MIEQDPIQERALVKRDAQIRGYHGSNLTIWQDPIEEGQYIATADVSTGRSHSASCCYVAHVLPTYAEVVACLWGFFSPPSYADKLHLLVEKYNHAFLCVEANTGETVLDRLVNIWFYDNLYYNQNLYARYVSNAQAHIPGIHMTEPVKRHAIACLSEALRDGSLIIYDKEFFQEAATFQIKQTQSGRETARAVSGKRDDRVMTMAIMALMLRERPFELIVKEEEDYNPEKLIWRRINAQRKAYARLQGLTNDEGVPLGLFTHQPVDDAERLLEEP